MNKLYHAAPDGYCGDEDNGQTSAWFVFSALGFYPVCPGFNDTEMSSKPNKQRGTQKSDYPYSLSNEENTGQAMK